MPTDSTKIQNHNKRKEKNPPRFNSRIFSRYACYSAARYSALCRLIRSEETGQLPLSQTFDRIPAQDRTIRTVIAGSTGPSSPSVIANYRVLSGRVIDDLAADAAIASLSCTP